MIYGGCDIGSAYSKAVLIQDSEILAWDIAPTESSPGEMARKVMEAAISKADVSWDDISRCISTGYGKAKVDFAEKGVGDAVSIAKALNLLLPEAEVAVDIGVLTISAIVIGNEGKVLEYVTNSKCASITGRFLDMMAKALELTPEELAAVSLESENPVTMLSQCGVFAESEFIGYINEGIALADIARGMTDSVGKRVATLVNWIGGATKLAVCGGVGKNKAVLETIEKQLGTEILVSPVDPQIVAALGAALVAKDYVP